MSDRQDLSSISHIVYDKAVYMKLRDYRNAVRDAVYSDKGIDRDQLKKDVHETAHACVEETVNKYLKGLDIENLIGVAVKTELLSILGVSKVNHSGHMKTIVNEQIKESARAQADDFVNRMVRIQMIDGEEGSW